VTVEGVAMVKKATRPSQKNQQGGIMTIEGTIHVSNVMLVCPSCAQPTRVGKRREGGSRVRVCKKCGKDIDK
jgi:large subunit ribosomal protein L24